VRSAIETLTLPSRLLLLKMMERKAVLILMVHAISVPLCVAFAAEAASAARPGLDASFLLQTVVRPAPGEQEVAQREDALAWQVVAASAMATSEARLGCTSILLLMLAGLRLTLQIRHKEPRSLAATPSAPEPSSEELRTEAEEEPPLEEPPAAEEEPLPLPRPRLQCVGATFTLGSVLSTGNRGPTLSLDIPSLPATWPLRAVLSRPTEDGPWASLELTVDIAAACELPPLLTCSLVSCLPHTGGTPLLAGPEFWRPDAGPADSLGSSASPRAAAPAAGEGGAPWLIVHNGGGHLLASISRATGGFEVRHHDGLLWSVELAPEAEAEEPWATVSRLGQPIGQAASVERRGERVLKIETLPEAKSPESALLLTLMLAMAAFGA